MKRSLQEVVELVVFGLIALLVGTGLLWVLGWVLSLGGALLKSLAGLLWLLLKFIVPVALVVGLIYFLVKWLKGDSTPVPATAGAPPQAKPAESGAATAEPVEAQAGSPAGESAPEDAAPEAPTDEAPAGESAGEEEAEDSSDASDEDPSGEDEDDADAG